MKILGRILDVIGILILIVVICICIPITIPKLTGVSSYNVISGSMAPAIPVGSLVYVQYTDPAEIQSQDVIAFYSDITEGAIITHRVIDNKVVSGEFVTKGDANTDKDPTNTSYDLFIGKVVKVIPYVGGILSLMLTKDGKIVAIGIVILGVAMHFIGSAMAKRK